jgi:hypothetical protein
MSKAEFPDLNEMSQIPKKLRDEFQRTELNSIVVRFFNQSFSKVIETQGIIVHKTAIPIIYFEKPFRAGVIMFDDTSYYDVQRKLTCIDVCESYPFTIDHSVELYRDIEIQYYNDIANENINKEKSEKLKDINGIGYFVPVFLNNIPIPLIRIEKDIQLTFLGQNFVKIRTDITQSFLRQIADNKLLARTGSKDSTVLVYCALLFTFLGIILGIVLSAYLFG